MTAPHPREGDSGPVAPAAAGGLRFDRMEWAGAFGDLGVLVPFVLAYVTQLGLDPAGVLLAFGVSAIVAGLLYRTPFPVQPMKAIGIAATTHAATFTPGMVYASGLVTGALWLLLAATGATDPMSTYRATTRCHRRKPA